MSGQWMQWLLRAGMDLSNQQARANEQSQPAQQPYPNMYHPYDPSMPTFPGPSGEKREGGGGENDKTSWNNQRIFGLDRFLFLLILILIVVAFALRIFYNQNHRITALERRNKYLVTHRQMQTYVNHLPNEDDDDEAYMQGDNVDPQYESYDQEIAEQQQPRRGYSRQSNKRSYGYDQPNNGYSDDDDSMQRHWQRVQQNRLSQSQLPHYDLGPEHPGATATAVPANFGPSQYPTQPFGGPSIDHSVPYSTYNPEFATPSSLPRKQLNLYDVAPQVPNSPPINSLYRCYSCQYVFERYHLHYECTSHHPDDISAQYRGICQDCKSIAKDHWRERPPPEIKKLNRVRHNTEDVKGEEVKGQRQAGKGSDPSASAKGNGLAYRQRHPPPPKRKPPKQPEKQVEQDSFFKDILSNPWSLLKNVAMGLGGGLVYSFVQNLTSKRCISYTLYPNPIYFGIDKTMSKYFHRAAEFRDWNEEAYCRALENTDRLFAHEMSIERRGPRIGDKALAKTWIFNIGTDIYNLRYDIVDEKARAKFNILARAILNRVMQHFRNIIRRVNTIYPKTAFLKQKEKRFPQRYERPAPNHPMENQHSETYPQKDNNPSDNRHQTANTHPYSDHEQEEEEPRGGSSSDTA